MTGPVELLFAPYAACRCALRMRSRASSDAPPMHTGLLQKFWSIGSDGARGLRGPLSLAEDRLGFHGGKRDDGRDDGRGARKVNGRWRGV